MEGIPESLVESVIRHLDEYRIHLDGDLSQLARSEPPVPMTVNVAGRSIGIAATYLPKMAAAAALHAARSVPVDVPVLVVAPRIQRSSAETLRAGGIWYVDGAGNAYMRDDAMLIDIRGRREPPSAAPSRSHKAGPANPFTPKRARVGLALLTEPSLADAPFREIADRSGVSLGLASGTISALEVAGFIERIGSHRRLIRSGELLDLWASAYPAGLGRASTLSVVRGDAQLKGAPGDVGVAISGEQAVPDLIRNPESLVLYIDTRGESRPLRDLMLMNRWHSDAQGNITIRDLFWRNLRPISGIGTAPPALIYADLLASNESRQREIAREMRRRDERLVQL